MGEYEIEFKPRNAVKAQILADFLAKTKEEDEETNFKEKKTKQTTRWKLYTDGASSGDGSGAGLIIVSPEGTKFTYALKFEFIITNNEAEYKVGIAGLRIAREMKIEEVTVFVDSQLVANQVNGSREAKYDQTKQYQQITKDLLKNFQHLKVQEKLAQKSIHEKKVAKPEVEEENSWMTPIIEYLISRILPEDKKLARKVRVKAPNYRIIDGILYKRSFLTPWLRCIGPKQAKKVIREIHGGACGLHAGPRSLIAKITTLGYYWPSMHRDSIEIIQSYKACRIHSPISRLPKQDMTSITAAWPFIQWGIDVVGPLPEVLGRVKFLIVSIDYFTKWVDAKPLASVTGKHVESWMTPIIEYLVSGILPEDKKLARKVGVKAPNYRIIDGILYNWSFLTPWMRCIGPK
ncbi:reverse transcriptase domain-containing protein [Tanacetum coccineum]